ncbi:MAG: response regulator [Myxococcales bacterium]|nr:response regulator [Myxococcales bacterium]
MQKGTNEGWRAAEQMRGPALNPLNAGFLQPEEPRVVVLADDDDDARASLRRALESTGARVVELSDALELVDYIELAEAEEFWPDVVIAAARMPGMEATELLERIHDWDPTLPVALIIRERDEVAGALRHRTGADFVLRRPVDSRQLAALATVLAA